mmetsp:Transcript_20466/g.55875  ORF Transcript_20466/g.55875 Transcript_20466/m.55875 type:complete len:227 (-) Transcript_20466:970-1650(-)
MVDLQNRRPQNVALSWRMRDTKTLEGLRQLELISPRCMTSCCRLGGSASKACLPSASMLFRWTNASTCPLDDACTPRGGSDGGRGCGGGRCGGGGTTPTGAPYWAAATIGPAVALYWASALRMRDNNTAEGFLQLLRSLLMICRWTSGCCPRKFWATLSSMPLRAMYSSTAPDCCIWFRTAWMREFTTAEGFRAFVGRASQTCCCSAGVSERNSAAHFSSKANSSM